MSARGDKKAKKGKKDQKNVPDPNAMTNVERTFYELTINDLNQKIAHLRTHLQNLGENNTNLKEKLRSLNEERGDVAGQRQTELEEKTAKLTELEERLTESIRIRELKKARAANKIEQLETKYKAMHDQLVSEIKLLNGQLNSLNDFRENRDGMLAKFDSLDQKVQEKERDFEEQLTELQQAAKVEKDQLKRDVEIKLLQFAKEYLDTTESRNAAYTRRLVRENIAIKKEIDLLLVDEVKLNKECSEHEERHKAMEKEYKDMLEKKKQLLRVAAQKGDVINKITNKYNVLKTQYLGLKKYKGLYAELVNKDNFENFQYNETSKRLCELGRKVDFYKLELSRMMPVHHQHEAEIIELRKVIERIKSATQTAIDTCKEHMDTPGAEHITKKSHDLVAELVSILNSDREPATKTPSAVSVVDSKTVTYHPGDIGVMPRKGSSLMDLFKRQGPVQKQIKSSLKQLQPEFGSQIIPTARDEDACTLMDVEYGSTLYVSSDREDNNEIPLLDEEPSDGGEEASSTSNDIQESTDSETGAPTSANRTSTFRTVSTHGGTIFGSSATQPTTSHKPDTDDEFDINFFY